MTTQMQDGNFIQGLFYKILIVIFQGLNLTEKNWEDVLNLTTFIHPECGAFPDIVRVKVVNYYDIEKNDLCDLNIDSILTNSRQFQLPKAKTFTGVEVLALWCGNPGHRGFRNDRERSEPSRPLQKARKDFAHLQSFHLPLPLKLNWISVTSL